MFLDFVEARLFFFVGVPPLMPPCLPDILDGFPPAATLDPLETQRDERKKFLLKRHLVRAGSFKLMGSERQNQERVTMGVKKVKKKKEILSGKG